MVFRRFSKCHIIFFSPGLLARPGFGLALDLFVGFIIWFMLGFVLL
jgi:hypothetical protein